MKNMTLKNLAEACGGTLHGIEAADARLDQEAIGITTDSREAAPGKIFIALKGTRVDGHRFIDKAFAQGALGVICEDLPAELNGPCLQVEDCYKALRDAAELYRTSLGVKVVGITGSMGKTTTKEFVAAVLETRYKVHKTEANYNNEVGVPFTIFAMPEDTEVAVIEMGINHFGEMTRLSKTARPDMCVFTNIGDVHLEFLGDRPGVLKAKSEIFTYMAPDAPAIVNGDDALLKQMAQEASRPIETSGFEADNTCYATDIVTHGVDGSDAVIHVAGMEPIAVNIPLPGAHMVRNAMTGAMVGKYFGLTAEEIREGIAAVKSLKGRGHVIHTEEYTILDDCYNANPTSMMAGIDTLSMGNGRHVAILGDMFELGAEEVAMHAGVGRHAAEQKVDLVLAVGEFCKALCEAAERRAGELGTKIQVKHFETTEALMEALPSLVQEGDTILVKASHAMNFPRIVDLLMKGENR